MKKIGMTALVALTAISLTAFSIGCEKKTETKKPAETKTPAETKKPAEGGGH